MKKSQSLLLLLVTTIFMLLTGTNAMAKGPSIKPDWSKPTTHTINLSGQTVTFTIPGYTSSDIPTTLKENLNIYDPEGYNEANSQELVKIWWDYKKRSALVFTDTLATMELNIRIRDNTRQSNTNLFESGALEHTLRMYFKKKYPDPSDKNRNPDSYKPIEIHGKTWLKYFSRGSDSANDRLCYSIPITSSHFMEVSFRIMEAVDRKEENWYETAKQDIEKIIYSFTVIYTKSANDK